MAWARSGGDREMVAGELGLEPRAFGFGDRRSNQLSYTPVRRQALAGAKPSGKRHHAALCARIIAARLAMVRASSAGTGRPK